jgi:N utilization substance protein B
MGKRRQGREAALQMLFQIDAQQLSTHQGITAYFANFRQTEQAPQEDADYADSLDTETRDFATNLVQGVMARKEQVEQEIVRAAHNWRLERMNLVDRNILRLSTYELFHTDIPVRVGINEAIELAKRFGTADSASFVNGILDKVSRSVSKPDDKKSEKRSEKKPETRKRS